MTESLHEPKLPRVTNEDLSQILFEDIAEPNHLRRWRDFAESNPELAREVLMRSYDQVHHTTTDLERVKLVMDILSYAVRALETAQQRVISDGVDDGEGRPLSA